MVDESDAVTYARHGTDSAARKGEQFLRGPLPPTPPVDKFFTQCARIGTTSPTHSASRMSVPRCCSLQTRCRRSSTLVMDRPRRDHLSSAFCPTVHRARYRDGKIHL